MTYPFKEAFENAKAHARKVFPEESCGLIVKGKYIACANLADDPKRHEEGNDDCACRLCSFEINPKVYAENSVKGIDMVVHSHPYGPLHPSKADMAGQLQTAKPWAIIGIDEDRVADKPVIWGGEIQPLIGREFIHGVSDCYTIIQDAYELGKDKLEEQGVPGWPYDPIILPRQPRTNAWWEGEEDLYMENFKRAGFVITEDSPKPGDVFLMKIRSSKYNHGGILVGNDLIVHHLPDRMSRREPSGLWGRQAGVWLRYVGVENA